MKLTNSNYTRFKDNYKPVQFIKLSNDKYYYLFEISFSNLTEIYEVLKNNPEINKKIFPDPKSMDPDSSFYGKPYKKTLEDLVNLKEKNYSEFMDLIKELEFIGIRNSYENKKTKSPTGGHINIPLYAAGHPLPYEMNQRIKKPSIITIHAGLGYSSTTKKEQVLNRAIILISIINALEKKGHQVKLTACELTYNSDRFPGEIVKIEIDIKKAEGTIDYNTLYKTLCPIEFLRRILFRVKETMPLEFLSWGRNYGKVCETNVVREVLQLDSEAIYFGQPLELGINGKNIEEDFGNCLERLQISDKISVREITEDYKERVRKINGG